MLRFGIIGTGIISTRHIKALEKNEGAQLVAVVDIDKEKAQMAADLCESKVSVYTDYKEMLGKEVLDAVIINLPHYLHEETTVACAEKRIHVLVEKPMSVSVESCKRMIQVCEKNQVVLQIGHVQSYFPENKKAKELILSGKLGKLLMIQDIRTSFYFPPTRPHWFLEKQRSGGGILMNLGAHSLDKIKFLTESSFEEVSGKCGFEQPGCEVEGNAQLFLRTKNGVTASITLCGYHDIPVNETTIYLTGGVLKLKTGTGLEIWKDGSFQKVVDSDTQMPFDVQLDDFVESILNGSVPFTNGTYSMEIISAIEEVYRKTGGYH